jgi:hypothetical protein
LFLPAKIVKICEPTKFFQKSWHFANDIMKENMFTIWWTRFFVLSLHSHKENEDEENWNYRGNGQRAQTIATAL